jgi:hypothetical protein
MEPHELHDAVVRSQLHPAVLASSDGGGTWHYAWRLLGMPAPVDPALGILVPLGKFSTAAMIAGYLGIVALVFGGVVAAGLVAIAFHLETDADRVILRVMAGILLVGVLPVAMTAALGHRAIRRDPSLKGMGRAGFAYAVCALLALAAAFALVMSVVK